MDTRQRRLSQNAFANDDRSRTMHSESLRYTDHVCCSQTLDLTDLTFHTP